MPSFTLSQVRISIFNFSYRILHLLIYCILKVKEGDYFAAGGWSGKIKRISHENGNNRADNRNFEKGRVPMGETGWGVRI